MYDPANLSALTYANGFTLWHYKTSDSAADVDSSGYFNEAARMLRAGDLVIINTGVGGDTETYISVVRSASRGVADVEIIAGIPLDRASVAPTTEEEATT